MHVSNHLSVQVLQTADLFLCDSGLSIEEDGFKRVELIGKGREEVLAHVELCERLLDIVGLVLWTISMHLV